MITSKIEAPLLIGFFLALLLVFAYQLGATALTSYDEAWYGEISRNIVIFKNPLLLQFNGEVFTDHPPLGYLMMAAVTAVLGSNEFSVRLVSVVTGAGCIVVTYLVGKKLYSRQGGIAAALVLFSSLWFIARTRSGNLDVPFVFWEVVTVYCLLSKNSKWLYWAVASFAALLLTKTLVGLGLLPVVLFVVWKRREELSSKAYLTALGLAAVLLIPWYVVNQLHNPTFLYHHFFEIGVRGETNTFTVQSLTQSFQYLAIGIGKWYKPFWLATVLGIVLFWKRASLRFPLALLAFWLLGFSPFLISSKTEIWHLLPLYPAVALLTALSTFAGLELVFKRFKEPIQLVALSGFVFLALFQFFQFSNLFYFSKPPASNEKDIALKAGKYPRIHLVETFYPATVYYSQRSIDPLHWHENAYQQMVEILNSGSGDVFIINRNIKNQLEQDHILFEVLDHNSSYYIVAARRY